MAKAIQSKDSLDMTHARTAATPRGAVPGGLLAKAVDGDQRMWLQLYARFLGQELSLAALAPGRAQL